MRNQVPLWARNPHCSCLQHRSWVAHPGYQTKEWELTDTELEFACLHRREGVAQSASVSSEWLVAPFKQQQRPTAIPGDLNAAPAVTGPGTHEPKIGWRRVALACVGRTTTEGPLP